LTGVVSEWNPDSLTVVIHLELSTGSAVKFDKIVATRKFREITVEYVIDL
jgi:hypothetical protein